MTASPGHASGRIFPHRVLIPELKRNEYQMTLNSTSHQTNPAMKSAITAVSG
jgi:hypothetical protein